MAELHIDSDWKKEAQEEKKRLAELEAQRKTPPPAPAAAASGAQPAGAAAPAGRGVGAGGREVPTASFDTLVQSIATQVFYYLGDLSTRGAEPMLNLDMAKNNIDVLGMLEEKTRGNLSAEEIVNLDTSLYETRMRFISIATQVASYP